MATSWRTAVASYYDPGRGGINGSYGAGAWPGHPIGPNTNGFAHKTMPFGTVVEFAYGGRHALSTCVDRGPFISGRQFDFLPVLANALGMHGVAPVQYRMISGASGSASAGVGLGSGANTTVGTNSGKIGLGLLGDLPSPLSDIGQGSADVATGAFDTFNSVPKFLGHLGIIFSGSFWLRVLMALGGVALIGFGLFMTGKEMTLGGVMKKWANSGSAPPFKL